MVEFIKFVSVIIFLISLFVVIVNGGNSLFSFFWKSWFNIFVPFCNMPLFVLFTSQDLNVTALMIVSVSLTVSIQYMQCAGSINVDVYS